MQDALTQGKKIPWRETPEGKASIREYSQRLKEERREAGLCLRCGHDRCGSTTLYCTYCKEYRKTLNSNPATKARRQQRYREQKEVLKERRRVYSKGFRDKLRTRVLNAYGGQCACCGEADLAFLQIDHVNGDGGKHRKEIGRGGYAVQQWLVDNNFPAGFQVLCANCNISKGTGKYCHHQLLRMPHPDQLPLFGKEAA